MYIIQDFKSCFHIMPTGEIFIPFYTGRVVDGIVIDKSEAEFTQAITVMALISAARLVLKV